MNAIPEQSVQQEATYILQNKRQMEEYGNIIAERCLLKAQNDDTEEARLKAKCNELRDRISTNIAYYGIQITDPMHREEFMSSTEAILNKAFIDAFNTAGGTELLGKNATSVVVANTSRIWKECALKAMQISRDYIDVEQDAIASLHQQHAAMRGSTRKQVFSVSDFS